MSNLNRQSKYNAFTISKLTRELNNSAKVAYIRRIKKYTKELINANFDVTHYINRKYRKYYDEFYSNSEVRRVSAMIKNDNSTRQAVMNFYNPKDDIPKCFTSVQFLLRRGTMHVIIFQRSMHIDKILQDISFFSYLASDVCKPLNIFSSQIKLHFHVGSLHTEFSFRR